MNNLDFFDIIIILSGVYFIYVAVNMKRTGTVSSSLVGKNFDAKKANDLPGFIEFMYMKSILIGIATVVCGVLDYCNEAFLHLRYFSLIVCLIYVVMLIVYGKLSIDAQKKYLTSETGKK